MNQRIKLTGYQKPLSSDYNISKLCVGLIMEIELPPDFKEFLKLLNARGVKYPLIGGYAVGYHGYPAALVSLVRRHGAWHAILQFLRGLSISRTWKET